MNTCNFETQMADDNPHHLPIHLYMNLNFSGRDAGGNNNTSSATNCCHRCFKKYSGCCYETSILWFCSGTSVTIRPNQ